MTTDKKRFFLRVLCVLRGGCFLCVLFAAFVFAQAKTWTLPEGAANEKSPTPALSSPELVKQGESLYKVELRRLSRAEWARRRRRRRQERPHAAAGEPDDVAQSRRRRRSTRSGMAERSRHASVQEPHDEG